MLIYNFEILKAETLKRNLFEKTRDYELKVKVEKNNKVIFDEVVKVRKNTQGVFPETGNINNKIKSVAERKEITDKIKEYIKRAR